jgi:hypothetical protein
VLGREVFLLGPSGFRSNFGQDMVLDWTEDVEQHSIVSYLPN